MSVVEDFQQPPFCHVSDMEQPLQIITDLARAVALIAETLQDDDETRSTVQRLAWMVSDQVKSAEALRGKLFHCTHPNRVHFDRVGWPSAKGSGE